MNNIIFVIFLAAAGSVYAEYSSGSYLLTFEGTGGGRVYGAASLNYMLDGSACETSAGASSLNYEINNGWYFTVNSDDVPPVALSGISAETLFNGNIKLSWPPAADNESFVRVYRVFRSVKENENGALLAETENTEYTDTAGLIFGIIYYYMVKPVDMAGNQAVIENPVIAALSKSLSTSVTSLSVKSLSGGRLDLSWQAVSGISFYRIYRSTVPGEKGVQVNADSTTGLLFSEITGSGLLDGTRYYYTVQGVDGSANEQLQGNNQASAVCDSSAPSDPVVFSSTHPDALPSTDNCPGFFWVESEDPKAPAGGATGVKGYYHCLSRSASEVFGDSWEFINGLSAKFEKIQDGEWFFHVLAADNAGNISAAAVRKIAVKTTGIISGAISDFDGAAVLKDIRLDLISNRISIMTGRTDLYGKYSFTEVPFGVYKLRIFKAGHNPVDSEEFTLSKTAAALVFNKAVNAVSNIGIDGAAVYPNPCRIGTVTFVYKVETQAKAVIDIYDSAGSHVAVLEETQSLTGFRETKWEASRIPSGVYFYVIKLQNSGNVVKFPVKKFSLIR